MEQPKTLDYLGIAGKLECLEIAWSVFPRTSGGTPCAWLGYDGARLSALTRLFVQTVLDSAKPLCRRAQLGGSDWSGSQISLRRANQGKKGGS